ncbi:rhamnogalacturonyl hydrolase YesR [Marinimicrobium koreense]|uniref:Rhamnogalacturonyl hydrolase YesR n=1 Tax=Marinimicrobium koreense TaxID=306545 RepID=A0A3N1P179_9GAMM|nr:glycoside hydrolase family 88 protein [Marinimicrobium koreense]ROQ18636.1 rhamnogalacturonyl hydrolase YesR [Marinimicrobium koreense]
MSYRRWPLAAALLLSATACTHQSTPESAGLSDAFEPEAIRTAANLVADWQLAQYDLKTNNFREEERASELPQGWVNATLNIGLMHWAEQSGQTEYRTAVKNLSEVNRWQLGPRVYDADDHAMGQVYIDLYRQHDEARMIEHTQEVLDEVVSNPSDVDLAFIDDERDRLVVGDRVFNDQECRKRWCWADAIFMAPPVFFDLSRLTGDPRYAEFAHEEFWATTEYLYNEDEHLYLRDSRYFERRDDEGRLIYWGRGNGWTLAGIARILDQMPEDFEEREGYERIYREMAARLVKLQHADGNWRSSLLARDEAPAPESSGTGLLVFALAWGLNNDLLEGEQYRQSVELGWGALVNAVQPSGKLGWVQQVGFAPGSATAEDTQLYGVGALLLAASEVYPMSRR